MAIKFSKANDFLNDIVSFSLPNNKCKYKPCIHSTDLCEKYCYGNCVFRHSNDPTKKTLSTETIALENYEASQKESFVKEVCEYISLNKPKRIRIHAIGDFYSLAYFEKWIEIMQSNPDVRFTAYTKSFDILKSYKETHNPVPSNFNVLLSVMPDTYDTYEDKNGSGIEYTKQLIDELQEYYCAKKYIVCSKEFFRQEVDKEETDKFFCNGGTNLFKDIDVEHYKERGVFVVNESCEKCLKCYSNETCPEKSDIYAVLRASSQLANLKTYLKQSKKEYLWLRENYTKNI